MFFIWVIREYERLVVFRWGHFKALRGPGLIVLIPFVDQGVKADLREQFVEIPSQTCITRDNAPIAIDFLIYFKLVEAEKSVLQVANFRGAAQGIATTTLRAVIGDIPLDDVLAKRDQINQVLRVKLDEVTERWGVKVTAVEIREILPPREVQEAMNRQMAAVFWPSATVTAASRVPSASVTTARRVRSALIWRVIASRISRGGTISRISTAVTLTPQRSVTSSSLARSTWLMCSRCANTSSSAMSPITARSVVVAMPSAACRKLLTSSTLFTGSTTCQ